MHRLYPLPERGSACRLPVLYAEDDVIMPLVYMTHFDCLATEASEIMPQV